MELLCISDNWIIKSENNKVIEGLKYLEKCTVMQETNFGYILIGYSSYYSYEKSFFIPISNKDEKDYSKEILEKTFILN